MNRYRNDLAVEFAFLLSFVSQVFRTASQFILIFTGYAKAGSDVFSRYAHVVIVFCAEQAIAHEQVFEDAVTHTVAAAGFSDGVGGVGHGFHTAGYDDVGIAEFDLLGCEGNGTHTGTAEFIQCESRNFLRNTRMEGYLTGRVFTAASLEYVAHDDFVDLIYRNTCAFDCFSNSSDTEVYSGDVCELAIETADGRTASTYDNSISH